MPHQPNSDEAALGSLIVLEARRWIGTPYAHRQRLRGVGVDCAGLCIEVGVDAGVLDWSDDAFAPFSRYSRVPHPNRFLQAVGSFMVPTSEWRPGAVAALAWRPGWPMHLGIVDADGPGWYLTHAHETRGACVRHGLDEEWLARVHSLWLYPGHAAALKT